MWKSQSVKKKITNECYITGWQSSTCFNVLLQAFRVIIELVSDWWSPTRTSDQKMGLISWIMVANNEHATQKLANFLQMLWFGKLGKHPPGILPGESHPIKANFLLLVSHPASKPKWWRANWTVKQSTLKARVECSSVELCVGRCLQQHALVPKVHFLAWENVFFTSVLILFQVTETRTGPLGCSSYDNLDSVSSILLQSPESKLHLQGKQTKHFIHMY